MNIGDEFELNGERHKVWNLYNENGVVRLTMSGYKDASGVPMFAVTEWGRAADGQPMAYDSGYKEHLTFCNVNQAKRVYKKIIFTFSPRYGFMLKGVAAYRATMERTQHF